MKKILPFVFIFLLISLLLFPKRVKVMMIDVSSRSKVGDTTMVYLAPVWSDSYKGKLISLGRMPKMSGRNVEVFSYEATDFDGNTMEKESEFALDIWFLYFLLPAIGLFILYLFLTSGRKKALIDGAATANTSNHGANAKISKPASEKHTTTDIKTNDPRAETTGDSKIKSVISRIKNLHELSRPFLSNTWPGTPEWDKLMNLENQKVETALTVGPQELASLEPFLVSSDPETRATAAYLIKPVHLKQTSIPVPEKIVNSLGKLLKDPSSDVIETAFDTLYHISKTTDIDKAVDNLINVLPSLKKENKLKAIEILGQSGQKTKQLLSSLKELSTDDSADIANVARNALAKLGVKQETESERAAVQKLLWTWKSSGSGIYTTEAACEELKKFPNPVIVCQVFKETLAKGDWSSDLMPGSWPADLCRLLGEMGDVRFLDDLIPLYLHFESKSPLNNYSGFIAAAVLRISGGWDRIRKDLKPDAVIRLVKQSLTVPESDGGDEVKDYSQRLSETEKNLIITDLKKEEKDYYRLCYALRRIGLASIDSLLILYNRQEARKTAANAFCEMPGALDSLSGRLTVPQIEGIIEDYYTYTGGMYWNENLIRFMAKLRTPKCLAYLNQEATKRYRDPKMSEERQALVLSLINSGS